MQAGRRLAEIANRILGMVSERSGHLSKDAMLSTNFARLVEPPAHRLIGEIEQMPKLPHSLTNSRS